MKKVIKIVVSVSMMLMLLTSSVFAAVGSKEVVPDVGDSFKVKRGACLYVCYAKTKKATLSKVIKNVETRKTVKVLNSVTRKGKKYVVTNIGGKAFSGCKKLKTIKVYCRKAPAVNKNAFYGRNTKKITVRVTRKMSSKEYKKFKTNLKKAGFKGEIKKL